MIREALGPSMFDAPLTKARELGLLSKRQQKFPRNTEDFLTERVGKVSYHPNLYVGTFDGIISLADLAETPEFQAQYPNHNVFAVDDEILGSTLRLRELNNSQQNREAKALLEKVLNERDIATWNCAFIQTGPRRVIKMSPKVRFNPQS